MVCHLPDLVTISESPSQLQASEAAACSGAVHRGSVDGWRRTARGWEHGRRWAGRVPAPSPITGVHPLVVAGVQLFGSLAVLIWASGSSKVVALGAASGMDNPGGSPTV